MTINMLTSRQTQLNNFMHRVHDIFNKPQLVWKALEGFRLLLLNKHIPNFMCPEPSMN